MFAEFSIGAALGGLLAAALIPAFDWRSVFLIGGVALLLLVPVLLYALAELITPDIRMQLDTVIRLYALFWVSDPKNLPKEVFEGAEINKLKASDGERTTDAYLRDRVAKTNDWISAVYRRRAATSISRTAI